MTWWITLFLFFTHIHFCLGKISDYLNTDITHIQLNTNLIDAAFFISNKKDAYSLSLQKECAKQNLFLTEYNKFHSLPKLASKELCSAIISPHLLTQILSHLSIYQYCLNNRMKTALVLENNAYLSGSLKDIEKLITHCTEKQIQWDILYTDVDFHDQKTGKFIIPHLENIPKNKQKVDSMLSKILCRYGTASFLISHSGMEKILNYFQSNWDNSPYDQTLFTIPNLAIYGSNIDIITNAHCIQEKKPLPSHNAKFYETGQEFWINPIELLTYDRFDAMAKYIYAYYCLHHYETNWHVELYKNHLENWIQFYNTKPLKTEFEDFQTSFNALLRSIRDYKFDEKKPIPINNLGHACNGSHRIGACLAIKTPIKVVVKNRLTSPEMTANVFRKHHHLEEKYLDHMAYEYTKLKKNTSILCLFPVGYEYRKKVKEILQANGTIVYHKDVWFNESGQLEFMHAIKWPANSNEEDCRIKANHYFQKKHQNIPIKIYLYEGKDAESTQKSVEELQAVCNEGMHFSENHESTSILASTVFNKNSIDFLNRKKSNQFKKFNSLLEKLKNFIHKYELDYETLCIDTGCVLSAFGLRECNDMDILHWNPLPPSFKEYEIDSHNPHLHHHSVQLGEILFNPENHFYYQGIKFASIDLIKKMKADRNSEKDKADLNLINSLEPVSDL